ncbi:MAG: helix-turn-helix transcriptional regulator [Saprospiraceae bacterium]|nr:helix-turn-helix transcriptional regulator [Saprospiraceae bacterium]
MNRTSSSLFSYIESKPEHLMDPVFFRLENDIETPDWIYLSQQKHSFFTGSNTDLRFILGPIKDLKTALNSSNLPSWLIFILKAREAVDNHLHDNKFNVTKLCKELATSRTRLHNKLKIHTGMSATRFVRAVRIANARELLLTTDLNISEIAYQCGFQLPHYFTRVFKEMEGCSPRDFREKNR